MHRHHGRNVNLQHLRLYLRDSQVLIQVGQVPTLPMRDPEFELHPASDHGLPRDLSMARAEPMVLRVRDRLHRVRVLLLFQSDVLAVRLQILGHRCRDPRTS